MKHDSNLLSRAMSSWFLIVTATALTLTASTSGFYAFILLWNATDAGLQFEHPARLAAGLGIMCATAAISLLGEAQYRFVFEPEKN